MPITKSAKKALRQSKRRALRNIRRRDAYQKVQREIERFVNEKKLKEAEALIPQAYQALDKAAKAGVLKPHAAARRKSRLTAWIRKARAAA
ncbi:MAG: 30S ribosomal protein S20 [bacterium]|nr:30S ribosomal protein S20 [bacterium]